LTQPSAAAGWAYGSHVIDALRWLIGEIEQVTSVRRVDISVRPDTAGVERACTAEDAFSASFTFANGATAAVDTAFAAPVMLPQQIQVFGTEGVIVLSGVTDLRLVRPNEADRSFAFPALAGDPHEPSFLEWAAVIKAAIAERRQIEPSFRDGLACAEVMDKIRVGALAVGTVG
jgi:predicted dehydrogenase